MIMGTVWIDPATGHIYKRVKRTKHLTKYHVFLAYPDSEGKPATGYVNRLPKGAVQIWTPGQSYRIEVTPKQRANALREAARNSRVQPVAGWGKNSEGI